ncbi:PAS domain S-box protein [Mucilaginibacter sp. UR6-11]|uniref:PAS domain-containing sensor histidine kinase n=1 Tax=Mucilaginibacter sp. UR6-11 TaxID=1435644 RepID=UPI001E5C51F0|nr:PAS domain S-box protein [Mucilaginibacter sp. UR6-11]MCC8425617.1 PAS domain S-box protein [Mucilaginibacter sp. UR6-11]
MNNKFDLNFTQSENIFRTLIEESLTPVGLYVGTDLIIKVANQTIIDIWGKGNDVINKPYFEVLPELKEQSIFKILHDVYHTGIAYEATEDRVDLVADGKLQLHYFNFSFKPLKDDSGKVWGVLNTAADVTELVLIRKQLLASEERTRFALNAAELGTWDLYPITQSVIYDERCRELFGFKIDESITYTDALKYVHPDDLLFVTTKMAESVNPDLRKSYDIKFRTVSDENNHIRWVRTIGDASFNDENVCTRFAGTVQDITREIADVEEQQKLVTLIDNTAEVIGITTLTAQVTYLNKAGYKMLGIDSYGEAFRPASEYFIPDDTNEKSETGTKSILETGRWEGERHYKHFKTGEPIPVYLNAFRIDDPATGKPIAMASVARDLRPEKEARNEQNKLLSLIDNSSDFVSLSDPNGNVTYVNTAGRKMMGLNNDTFERHNSEYLLPSEIDKLKTTIAQALEKDGRWTGEINYRNFETGEAIPVSATTMLVYDTITGKPVGRASIARDLRREIADKRALKENEHLLHNITTAAPIALWMSDPEGNITYANKTWMTWTGMTYEETLGNGWLNAIVEEDKQNAATKFLADLQARRAYEVNFRILNKAGDIRWCIATGNPQYRSDGSFAGYIGACTDITEKTLAEQQLQIKNEELKDQIEQYEFVTGFMPVQLWTSTLTGELDYVNQRTLDFFGTDRKEIIGPEWILRVHPEDRDECITAWTHSLQTGAVYQCEFRLRDKNGEYKWHLARALPFISDGKIIKWFGTNTDIDEQKQLQRQKDDFLGIASHELKTPVTSIKAYAQVLGAMLTKEGEAKKAEMVIRMDAQVNRLTNLIGDLLDVTKINSGKLLFNKTWFDFNQAIHETVEDLQHTTQKHKLITEFTETGKIFSDKDRISQVITNLITNAIKYSPHSDKIIIQTKLTNGEVIICVQDFGIGIPRDKADRVFEQFYRVSGNKQHTFPGLGLGLYISSEIIKREGGKIWVNSVEGKGSDFCFSLPVNNQQTEN